MVEWEKDKSTDGRKVKWKRGIPWKKRQLVFLWAARIWAHAWTLSAGALFVEEQRGEDPAGKGDGSEGAYVDRVPQYGNMVSASVPYALCEAIREGRVRRGDLLLLMGTAAGLTVNFMLLRY